MCVCGGGGGGGGLETLRFRRYGRHYNVIRLPKSVNHYSSGLKILMHGFISPSQTDKDDSSVN